MKLKTCRFEIYITLDWNNERKCWNFCRLIFFHFDSKKGGTITCFFSPPVQRHLRLVANCDDVTIHSTRGGTIRILQTTITIRFVFQENLKH